MSGRKGQSEMPEAVVEAAKPTEQAEAVATEGQEKRAEVATDVAEGVTTETKPADALPTGEDLPENDYKRLYMDYRKFIEKDPANKTPIMMLLVQVVYMLAKLNAAMDMLPNGFIERLRNDEVLNGEELADDERDKILATAKGKEPEALEKDRYKGFERGKASTNYICEKLWGIKPVNDPAVLAAKLLHTKKTGEGDGDRMPYFRPEFDVEKLEASGMPFGTVLIFSTSPTERIVAYATGEKNEYRYFDVTKNEVVKERLGVKGNEGGLTFMAAFVPQFNSDPKYFNANPKQLVAEVDDTPTGEVVRKAKRKEELKTKIPELEEKIKKATEKDLSTTAETVKLEDELEKLKKEYSQLES